MQEKGKSRKLANASLVVALMLSGAALGWTVGGVLLSTTVTPGRYVQFGSGTLLLDTSKGELCDFDPADPVIPHCKQVEDIQKKYRQIIPKENRN